MEYNLCLVNNRSYIIACIVVALRMAYDMPTIKCCGQRYRLTQLIGLVYLLIAQGLKSRCFFARDEVNWHDKRV